MHSARGKAAQETYATEELPRPERSSGLNFSLNPGLCSWGDQEAERIILEPQREPATY